MSFFSDNRLIIEDTLSKLLEGSESLYEAARYSTLSEAKRIRPLIVLAIAVNYNVPIENALMPSCALELLHTYTLIHDDLPCMDDEVMRRGKPPLHHKYPEGLALLTGDALLTLAFDTLANAPNLDPQMCLNLIQTLTKRSGINGVIKGQALDLYAELNEEQMIEMYRRKTADLFTAAFEFGAILADVDPEPLHTFGETFGLAFQFADDLEDDDCSLLTQDQVNEKLEILIEKLQEQSIALEIPPLEELVDYLSQKWGQVLKTP